MIISRQLFTEVLAHLQAVYPEEGCGFIAGRDGIALAVFPVENRLHSAVTYEMDPQQQIETLLEIEASGWQMMAIFHSHPQGPDEPSAADLAQAYYPEAQHLIVSYSRPDMLSYRLFAIGNGRAEQATLTITE